MSIIWGFLISASIGILFFIFVRHSLKISFLIAIAGCLLNFGIHSVRTVPANFVAVVDYYGSIEPDILKAGLHIINPFSKTVNFLTCKNIFVKSFEFVASDKKIHYVRIDITYNLDEAKIPSLYRQVHQANLYPVLAYVLQNFVDEHLSSYSSIQLSEQYSEIEEQFEKDMRFFLGEQGIMIKTMEIGLIQ